MNTEIDRAASYVISLINPPINDGVIKTKWKFVPSRRLGGDCFGYHWIDDENFSIYLLDVSGHGIGPALHAVSVMNLLCNENLTGVDFRRPEQVLDELNKSLKMDSYDDMFLTVFYLVYNKKTRELRYSEAGHPPALLFKDGEPDKLKAGNFVIGGDMKYKFQSDAVTVAPGSDLYVYSDGAYEIEKAGGDMMQMDELADFIKEHRNHDPRTNELEDLYVHLLRQQRTNKLEDDFSILKVTFL